ncbi:MAG TPA: hypothetical protein VIC56_08910 [Gemmatimonadota bacterium]|jgi:hypothetical protein
MSSSPPAPALSVFTIGFRCARDCRRVLADLRRQTIRGELDVLVVAPDASGLEPDDLAGFAEARILAAPVGEGCGRAMAAAVRTARAPFVAYAEEHSLLDGTWAEAVLRAHRRGYDVVGFAIENANPGFLTSWAQLYGYFAPVVAPVESGETDALGGHHVSYRRDLLLEYGERLAEFLEDEAALFLDLRARGVPLFVAGDAVTRHVNVSRPDVFLRLEYLGQRSFAATRAATGRWRWWKRAAYAAAAPLVPWIRLRRILPHIRRTGRARQLLPQILGPLLPALAVGAWGEMLGYLAGGGACAERKSPVELSRRDFLAERDDLAAALAPAREPPDVGR